MEQVESDSYLPGVSGAKIEPSTILLLGAYRQALAVARDLHGLNWRVVLGQASSGRPSAFGRSRAVDAIWRYPPVDQTGEFLAALTEFLSANPEVAYVLPIGSTEVWALDKLRQQLPSGVRYVMPNSKAIRTCAHKPTLLRLVESFGVPVASYRLVESTEQLCEIAADLDYPCVVRPASEAHRLFGGKALIAQTHDDLLQQLVHSPAPPAELIVQREVAGERHCLYFFASEGNVLAAAQMRVKRTDRVDGTGYAVDAISVPVSERWLVHLDRLIEELNYCGFGCLQYIADPRTGEETFLEVNTRLGGNHAGLELIGMHQARWAIEMAGSGTASIATPFEYSLETRYRWFYGDLMGFLTELRSGRLDWHSATRWLLALPGTLLGGGHLVWSWKDPLPSIYLFSDLARAAARKANERIQRYPVRRWINRARTRRRLAAAARASGTDPALLCRVYDYHTIHWDRHRAPPQQRPQSYFPGLTAKPVHDPSEFPWAAVLEDHYETIRDEVVALRTSPRIKPHHQNLADQGSWNTLYFYTGGRRIEETHELCPQTSKILDSIPLAGSSGQVYFSLLAGHTHIKPHCGPTNVRLRCHFGILVPDGCRLRVGSEILRWQMGRCLFFDDSFEHEVWNPGNEERIVLIIDVWHPELTPEERWAIDYLAQASEHIRQYRHAVEAR